MPLRESTLSRLGLAVLAIALWRIAGPLVFDGLLPHYPAAAILLSFVYVVSFGALLASASSSERLTKIAAASMGAFALAMLVFAFRDAIRKVSADYYPTTDGHLFMEIAARFVLAGKNPYAERLADAFRIYPMPLSQVTPLVDGDFSDRVAYPALSFLVLVPALLLHVPTYLVYACAFVAAAAIVIQKAPGWARPFVVAALISDESFSAFAFGGVTDTVWVLFLVGAAVWWRSRPVAAAVLVGLACSYKQHPWFLVPLLVLRVAYDHGERPWGSAVRRFLAVVGGVFVALNIVFVLIGPHRWLNGVTEPLAAPMAQLSEGITAFSMTGYLPMPRRGTSAIFWATYALAVFAYARHTRMLRRWCWVLPAVVLWFSYRALMSYWYFFGLAAMVSLFADGEDSSPSFESESESPEPSWRPLLAATGVWLAVIAGFLVWCASRPPAFVVTVAGPTDAWERFGFGLRVRVENKLDHVVFPQFWLQSTSQQPLPWVREHGPGALEPGESGFYLIRAGQIFAQFDIGEGARLEVRDRMDAGQRGFITVPGDRTLKTLTAVPNRDFRIVDSRTRIPTAWTYESSSAKLVVANDLVDDERVRFVFGASATVAESPLSVCVLPQHVGGVEPEDRKAVLSTMMPIPEGKIGFRVNVPANANRPPYDTLYGVVLAVRDFHVVVLFGDDVPNGKLPSGETFVSIAAPRGVWTTVEIAPRAILERLNAPLTMIRFKYLRAPLLDFPSVPLELGMMALVPSGVSADVRFGRLEQGAPDTPETIAKRYSEAGLTAWRAELDIENGNYRRAAERLELANQLEPTRNRAERLGDAYLLAHDYKRAREAYLRVFASTGSLEAEKGLGFALIDLGDLDTATKHLEHARDEYAKFEKKPRLQWVGTLRGLARIRAKKNDCEAAVKMRELIAVEVPDLPPANIEPCK